MILAEDALFVPLLHRDLPALDDAHDDEDPDTPGFNPLVRAQVILAHNDGDMMATMIDRGKERRMARRMATLSEGSTKFPLLAVEREGSSAEGSTSTVWTEVRRSRLQITSCVHTTIVCGVYALVSCGSRCLD